jgi:hypothetical protein
MKIHNDMLHDILNDYVCVTSNGLPTLNISTNVGVKEKLCYKYIAYYLTNIKHFNVFHSSSPLRLKNSSNISSLFTAFT